LPGAILTCGANYSWGGFATDPNAAVAYVDGNVFNPADSSNINTTADIGSGPLTAPSITETDALTVACSIINEVGPRPLSDRGSRYGRQKCPEIARFDDCGSGNPTLNAPSNLTVFAD